MYKIIQIEDNYIPVSWLCVATILRFKRKVEVENLQYNIRLFERKAICPKCSGMLTIMGESLLYRCVDCREIFEVVSDGITDKETVCRQIKR